MSTITLGGVFGTSRSGSTWLGSILASHPGVAYRFEPFHRLAHHPRIREARQLLESDRFEAQHLDLIYKLLLPADPLVDKPPFFPKRYASRTQAGRSLLWPAARKSRIAADAFRWLYTPVDTPTLVFKEVNMEAALESLVIRGGTRAVYLLRHPCAVVWSHIRGEKLGVMHDKREAGLLERLQSQMPELHQRVSHCFDQLTKAQRRALLWRLSVDRVTPMLDHPRCLLVIYENLCRNPAAQVERIFRHFDLPMSSSTLQFLQQSTAGSSWQRMLRGQWGRSSYFSVFRNPDESMNAWQSEMPEQDRADVLELVGDSAVFQLGVQQGNWCAQPSHRT